MNRTLWTIVFFLLSITACSGNKKQETISPLSAQETAISSEEIQTQGQSLPTLSQNSVPSENVANGTPNTITETTPSKKQETPKNEPTIPPSEDTPQDWVTKARKQQSLSLPVADKKIFSDEELIPLQERRLSPLAYFPLSDEKTNAPWDSEQLKYGVYYSFIKAGTAYIKNRGLIEHNGRKAFLIQTTAFSASVIDAFFKVRDINLSWIDTQTLYSLGYTQSVREGRYRRDEWVNFDTANKRYYGEVQKKKEPHIISGELETNVLDMLSSLYYVRAQKLEVGKDIVFDIINREKQYPLIVKVLKKETVKTEAGKFDCIVVEPQFRGEGIFVSKGKSLKVWLTDDEYKMPVKMKAEVFIGSVSAELLEYKRN